MFVDTVHLKLSAGRGGNGVIAWRREKYIPKGGPAGGDGGKGGSIIFEVNDQIHSLEGFRNWRFIKAKNGTAGGSNNCKGKKGPDLLLQVPKGTLVKDPETGKVLADLTEKGQKWEICQGGRGGFGNTHFKTSTHQAPFRCTPGKEGEQREVDLELKLIADIGFVGMPNAGKSTLIAKLAHVKVKIAPYPFTTLRPNLGIVEFEDFSRVLIADIPGIIENAHENRGLGFSFLRHIERTSGLIFVIELAPGQDKDPLQELFMLQKELSLYREDLLQRPFLVVINKIDQEGVEPLIEDFIRRYPFPKKTLFFVSALEGTNTASLKEALKTLTETLSFA